jgi:signal peptide peptidase SppA
LQYAHVLHFALSHPWALDEPYRQIIASALAHHLLGVPDPVALHAADMGRERRREQLPQPRKGGAVAVIPIHGPIVPRGSMMTEVSGLASTEGIAAAVHDAVANPDIKQIILDIDSPGGNVAGCTECVEAILAAREKKPIIAQAHFTMGSAAYWIGSAATEIVANPSAQVGSIGVFAIHNDVSKALEALGVKRTYIVEGKHKLIAKDSEPLSEADSKEIAAKVREFYDTFVTDVARSRKVPVANVRNGYGEGRTVGAQQALSLGMVDRIATLDETIARLSPTGSIAAETLTPELTADEIAWRNALFAELQTATL